MALEYILAATIAYAGASGTQHTAPVVGTYTSHSACMQAITDAQVEIKSRDPKAMTAIAGGTICKPQEIPQPVFGAQRRVGERLPNQDQVDSLERTMMAKNAEIDARIEAEWAAKKKAAAAKGAAK